MKQLCCRREKFYVKQNFFFTKERKGEKEEIISYMRKKGAKVGFIIMLAVVLVVVGGTGYVSVAAAMDGTSALAKVYADILDVVMTGDKPVSAEDTLDKVEKRRKVNASFKVSGFYKFLYSFDTEEYDGFEVCYFGEENADRVFVYFHGGSYMWQPLITHYSYCDYLAEKLSARVIMPVYPKAPEYDYIYVMEWLYSFYKSEFKETPDAFFGDSAGGGLLLSFAMYLRDKGEETPDNLIAFSPCLDLSLQNPEIADYTASDPMLNVADLRLKLSYYVGRGKADDPYASPLFGSFENLGRITIFIGTREILYPDTVLLKDKLLAAGIEYDYCVYKNQIHTFSIFPMPEREICLEKIKSVLS